VRIRVPDRLWITAFLGKNDLVKMAFQFFLIVRAVEALVKTTGFKMGELRLVASTIGTATLSSVFFLHHWAVQD